MDANGFLGLMCFFIGAALMALMAVVLAPNHKADCDSFGMTRMGGQVYECKPRQPVTK